MLINYPGLVTPEDYTRAAEYAEERINRARRAADRAAWCETAAALRAGAVRAAADRASWPTPPVEADYRTRRASEDPDYAARLEAYRAAADAAYRAAVARLEAYRAARS